MLIVYAQSTRPILGLSRPTRLLIDMERASQTYVCDKEPSFEPLKKQSKAYRDGPFGLSALSRGLYMAESLEYAKLYSNDVEVCRIAYSTSELIQIM